MNAFFASPFAKPLNEMTTRRRFYAPLPAFAPADKIVTLGTDETRHARNVLRLKPGDDVYVFDGEGHEYRCRLAAFDRHTARLDLIETVEPARPESRLSLTLAVALLKGEKFDLVVQKATELGVTRLIPIVTARADVRIRDERDAERKLERWRRIVLESIKQCGRAQLMKIDAPEMFESVLAIPEDDDHLRLIFAERNGSPLSKSAAGLSSRPKKLTALIGSEGGWTDDEISKAREQDWKIVTLGGRTLRAETAAIAIAALLQHAFGDLV